MDLWRIEKRKYGCPRRICEEFFSVNLVFEFVFFFFHLWTLAAVQAKFEGNMAALQAQQAQLAIELAAAEFKFRQLDTTGSLTL